DFAVSQRTRFSRSRRDILEHGGELGPDELSRYAVNPFDAGGVLHCEQRNHSLAIDPELVKCLEISLNTSAARGVRTGDGQRDRNHAVCSLAITSIYSENRGCWRQKGAYRKRHGQIAGRHE